MIFNNEFKILPASFRDPDGFVFFHEGMLLRRAGFSYEQDYRHLIESGLYETLIKKNLLIPHLEIEIPPQMKNNTYKVIQPEPINFISYPYEWCFSQLKHAALITLEIQKNALQFGMSLKDASAYNIQFRKMRPVFIDTFSFRKTDYRQPWAAYGQFCRHFLAPLALMRHKDIRLNNLLKDFIDGIPLDLTAKLLDIKFWKTPGLFMHINMHAQFEKKFARKINSPHRFKPHKFSLDAIVEHLKSTTEKLQPPTPDSQWTGYYQENIYSANAFEEKKSIIRNFLDKIKPSIIWDLGANTGVFSRESSKKGIFTLSLDADASAIEKNYQESQAANEKNILPLVIDIANPSPGIGWENQERNSILDRGPCDLAMALALIHHLTIGNNLPFKKISAFLKKITTWVIIEFVGLEDPQTQKLLAGRNQNFTWYTEENFRVAFSSDFQLIEHKLLPDTTRTIYLFKTK